MRVLLIALLIALCGKSWGAIDRVLAPDTKKHVYIEHGTIQGGDASGRIHSLLDIRRIHSPKDKIERIILDIGDQAGKPLKGRVSYFQVGLNNKTSKVVIDLSQMGFSGIDAKKLEDIFKGSPNVKSSKINFDPVDTTISLQLELKKTVQVEAFQIPSTDKASRIALDLKTVNRKK